MKHARYAIYTGLFAVPFLPFLVTQSMLFPYITGKAFAFQVIIEIVFALYLILVQIRPAFLPKPSKIMVAVFGFLMVISLSDIFAGDQIKSIWSNFERMEGLVMMVHLGAYFVVLGSMFGPSLWMRFFNVNIAASAGVCIYSLFQIAGRIPINQGGVRVDGTFGNATYLAGYLLLSIFLTLYLVALARGKKALTLAYSSALLMQGIVLYFTASRGAFLGLVAGLLFIGIGYSFSKRRLWGIAGLALLFLVGSSLFFLSDSALMKKSDTLARISSISFRSEDAETRFTLWKMAFEGLKEKPLLGWGQEGFNQVFAKHYDPSLYSREPWFDRAHNVFVDWLVAGGILGLISYMLIYVFSFMYLFKYATFHDKVYLGALLTAYAVFSFFVFDNLMSYVFFFTIIAYIHVRTRFLSLALGLIRSQG
jgi:O-antigen ligase